MKKLKKVIAVILIAAVIMSIVVITASAGSLAYGVGTISVSVLNIRSGPDTTHKVIGTARKDAKVVILEQTNDTWYHINYNGIDGYVACRYLKDISTEAGFTAAGALTDDTVRLRSMPTIESDILATYDTGDKLVVLGLDNGWYKVKNGDLVGYIRSDYFSVIGPYVPAVAAQWNTTDKTPNKPVTPPIIIDDGNGTELGNSIANMALQYVGYAYVYGGASPEEGFDCSGLVYYVLAQHGYEVYHGATSQYSEEILSGPVDELQVGDLLFFSDNGGYDMFHVGIYIGGGQFVHAANSDSGVKISELDSEYWGSYFYAAKRIVEAA